MALHIDDIKAVFDESKWHVGAIDHSGVMACATVALKHAGQPYGVIYYPTMAEPGRAGALKDAHYALYQQVRSAVILVRHSAESLDYSLYTQADEMLQKAFPHPRPDERLRQLTTDLLDEAALRYLRDEAPWFPLHFDFKQAAILAGLGIRARNSLVYDHRFGFDCKICAFGFKEEIVGAEAMPDFGVLDLCEGCTDCHDNCPADAIHNECIAPWFDVGGCVGVSFRGCAARGVPGILDAYHEHLEPDKTRDEVERQVKAQGLQWEREGYRTDPVLGVVKDGKVVPTPTCRICQEQPRCGRKKKTP